MNNRTLYTTKSLISDQVTAEQIRVILEGLMEACKICDGAVVEFGCYVGTTSLFIQRTLDKHFPGREFHVYDSFEGLPPKTSADESRAGDQFQVGELKASKKQFVQEFKKANLAIPIIHKGWFNHLGADDVPDKIAFAFLDGDFYESIRDSLRLVMPRMQDEGVIIIDDYTREALPGVERAVREVMPRIHGSIKTERNMAIIRLWGRKR